MIRLEKIFRIHFHTDKFGNGRLRAFSEDHINKLTAWLTVHTDADLSDLLNNLLSKHNDYFGCISDEKIKSALQQGRTIAIDNAWAKLLDFIRRKEGIARSTWGKDSPEYQEFYPYGLDEYNRATKLNKETLLKQYLDAATAYQAQLGAQLISDFTDLKNDWQAKFSQQQKQIGLVKDANSMTALNRAVVEEQLWVNVLIIAAKNAGKPQMVNDFFNQSLLKAPDFKLPKEGLAEPGELRLVVDLETFDPEAMLKLINVSGGPFEFGLSHDRETFTGKTIMLAQPSVRKIALSEFEANATLLMVRNTGATVGRWKVARG